MRELKRSNKARSHIMSKAILVSILLAVIGVMSAIYLYQYTYANKLEIELNNKQSELQTKSKDIEQKASELNLSESQKLELQRQVDELNKQKEELNKQLQAKAERAERVRIASVQAAQAASAPKVVSYTTPAPQAFISGSKQDWMSAAGIAEPYWQCADALITKESGWRVNAQNPSSSAYGIPQSLPGNKMASAGADWQTSPVTQLRWMLGYVNARYGGFCQAWSHSQTYNWY